MEKDVVELWRIVGQCLDISLDDDIARFLLFL
jgi:hypothetical protein